MSDAVFAMTDAAIVWLPVDDAAAYVRANVLSRDASTVTLRRLDDASAAPVAIAASAFAQLSLAREAADAEPAEDLSTLADTSDASYLDALRRRYHAASRTAD